MARYWLVSDTKYLAVTFSARLYKRSTTRTTAKEHTMTKTELAAALAERTGQTKTAAGSSINALVDIVTEELKQGGDVRLIGFGTFATRKREARTGRNPQTGKKMKIKARTVPVFRPGSGLKDAVASSKKK
jgi:DNA-binding protein HU-beta